MGILEILSTIAYDMRNDQLETVPVLLCQPAVSCEILSVVSRGTTRSKELFAKNITLTSFSLIAFAFGTLYLAASVACCFKICNYSLIDIFMSPYRSDFHHSYLVHKPEVLWLIKNRLTIQVFMNSTFHGISKFHLTC